MKVNAKELVEKMEKERGFGMPWRRILAERDADFMLGIHELNMHAMHRKDGLPHKYVEMLICVIDALTGADAGFKVHLRAGLQEGLTEIEMLQALEICTMSGIHYTSKMLPALEEVAQSLGKEQKKPAKKKTGKSK